MSKYVKNNYLNINAILSLFKFYNVEDDSSELITEIEKQVDELVENVIKTHKKKSRIKENDAAKEMVPFNEIYDKDNIRLPAWILDDLDNAVVLGTSKKVIQISDGRKYHLDNPLNDLSGGEWTYFLRSVINTRYSTQGKEGYAHEIRKIHPSPKPPQLMSDIIKFFTKGNEKVLDYFMGVGGTLLGAALSNRQALGIDLNEDYINAYKEAAKKLNLPVQKTIVGNSIEILNEPNGPISEFLKDDKFSLILIDPPYGDMMARKKTGEASKKNNSTAATPFTDSQHDLGNMGLNDFLPALRCSVQSSMQYLKNKGHVVLFTKDFQPKDKELNILHCDIINEINKIPELKYLGTKIWADESVNLYPYGYPFAYVANQIHQYIIIFKKENNR